MKHLFFLSVIFFLGCKESQEITTDQQAINNFKSSAQMATTQRSDYESFTPGVKFITQKEQPNKTTEVLIQEQKAFILASGLPDVKDVPSWLEKHSVNDAVQLYFEYENLNQGHQYLSVFLQYEGWLILTKMHLLQTGTDKQIYDVLSTMINAGYKGYGVINYSLNLLKNHGFDNIKVKAAAQQILNQSADPKPIPDSAVSISTLPPFARREIEQKVNSYYRQQAEDYNYLNNIKALATSN